MISGFNIVVSTSLHISKDWPCVLKVTCLSLPGFGTFRVTDCERCRLEGGFICSSEPDKGRLREKLLPRVLAFCTLCDLVVGI